MPSFGFGSAVTSACAHASVAPVADAQAVSALFPAFRSAWVIVCVPVHSIVLPVARVVRLHGGSTQLPCAGVFVSLTFTLFRVTLPSLVAMILYLMTSPTLLYSLGVPSLVIVRCGFCLAFSSA